MGLGMEAGEGMLPPTTYYLPFSSQKSKIVACATASKTAHWSRWIKWCRIEQNLDWKHTPAFRYEKRIQCKYRGKNWEFSIYCMVIIFEVNTWWYLREEWHLLLLLDTAEISITLANKISEKIWKKLSRFFFLWKILDDFISSGSKCTVQTK